MDFAYRGPGSARPSYVIHAAPACEQAGCQFSKSARLLEQARAIIEQEGRDHMSQALWCDQGDPILGTAHDG